MNRALLHLLSRLMYRARRTAICRGAVFKGFLNDRDTSGDDPREEPGSLPITVTSTVSRASFGIEFHAPFKKDEHLQQDKIWDIHEGVWKAKNQMHWFLRKVSKKFEFLSLPGGR